MSVHNVVFIGVCDKANTFMHERVPLNRLNILGLRNDIISFIYPFNFRNTNLLFGININALDKDIKIILLDDKNTECLSFRISPILDPTSITPTTLQYDSKYPQAQQFRKIENTPAWIIMPFTCNFDSMIMQPGIYVWMAEYDGITTPLGYLEFIQCNAFPLTVERLAAIRSDPAVTKFVKSTTSCSHCGDSITGYATANERDPEKEREQNLIYYSDLPDTFVCSCGKTSQDISSIKKNLHGYLGQLMPATDRLVISNEFRNSSCNEILRQFWILLKENHKEEIYQNFLEKNTILLNLFSPKKIFFKKPILTKYCTDIAIIDHQNDLILIEIEKPSTRILKHDGHKTSDLSHAVDQVFDWLRAADEHRFAIFETLNVRKDEVSSIRGAVIAGRDVGYPQESLHKLKGQFTGRLKVYTYDDIYTSLSLLNRSITGI